MLETWPVYFFHDSKEIMLILITYLEAVSHLIRFFSVDGSDSYLVWERAKLSMIHLPCISTGPWPLSTEVMCLSCYLSSIKWKEHVISNLKDTVSEYFVVIMLQQLWSVSALEASPNYCKIFSLFIVSVRNKTHGKRWSLAYLEV